MPSEQPGHAVSQSHIRRVLRRAGPVDCSTCLIASKVDAPYQAVRATLREMDGVECHSRPGLGGGQWRLEREVSASD